MKLNGLVVLLYGLIILVGGIMGHVKAGSNASLISGLLFGSILIASAWLILLNKKSGLIFALFSTVILDGFFTFRFLFTKKFLPPGALSLLSLGVLIFLVARTRHLVPKKGPQR